MLPPAAASQGKELADLQQILAEAGLMHPCDLDLLLFFNRHPKAIMSSEQIAAFVGYDLAQIGRSLDLLEGVGLLRRSLNPTHVGRFYTFTAAGGGVWLQSLLSTSSTPDGRRSLIRLLHLKSTGRPGQPPVAKSEDADRA